MKLWRYGRAIEILGQRYRLEGMLGSGGMADVCLAWDEREQCEVAIKVLKPGELEQKALDRFQKEAAQVARWRHPNILRFYGDVRLELLDAVQGSIVPYIVMEYAPGGDLHKRLRPGQAYPLAQTLSVFVQLCRAVAYAHEQGVIHRDLKPMNILFRQLADGTEQAVLSDFGLAVEIDASHFTYAGAGTLPYMAPEQLRGHAQPASDIFALGVILYQLCTGQLPFKRTLQDLGRRRPLPAPALPSSLNPQLPPELDAVILSALASDPADRYGDAMQFWQSVQDIIDMETFQKVYSLTPNDPSIPAQPGNNSSLPGYTPQRFNTPVLPPPPASQMTRLPTTPIPPNTRMQTNILRPPDLDSERHTSNSATHPRAIDLPSSYERDTGPYARSLRSIPAKHQPATPYTNPPARQRRPHWLFIGSLFLLGLLLIGIVTAYTVPNLPNPLRNILPGVAPAASNSTTSTPATVTITPNSQLVQDNYLVHAVPTSTPDAALHQVTLRTVSFKTPDLTKPVTGTGKMVATGVRATGKIHFSNGSSTAYTIAAGSVFHATGGIDIANNDVTTVPGGSFVNGNIVSGTMDDDATTVQPGAAGDIVAGAVNLFPCCGSTSVLAVNTAFTGGQDPQDYSFIQTSDVSSVVDPLKAQLLAAGQKGVHDQVKANEQMVNDITCRLAQPVDQTVGPDTNGQSITTANVTLVETCTAQVYDQGGEQSLVRSLLTQKATGNLGPGYALVGNIMLNPGNSTLNSNDLDLMVGTKGVWVYQFTDKQKQNLLNHIAGKTSAEARTYLQSQTGVSGVKVDISNGGSALPTDTTQIALKIQSVSGASGGSTTPAPTVTTNGPGSGPAPTVTGFGLVGNQKGVYS